MLLIIALHKQNHVLLHALAAHLQAILRVQVESLALVTKSADSAHNFGPTLVMRFTMIFIDCPLPRPSTSPQKRPL